MTFIESTINNIMLFIRAHENDFVVGFISGLISSIIVTIVNNRVLEKSKSKYNNNMKRIFAQDLNILISKNTIDDFVDSIIASLKTSDLNNDIIKEVDKVLPILAGFASVEEITNLNTIKLILKKMNDISSLIVNYYNGNKELVNNAIIDIYSMYKSEIDKGEIVLLKDNKLLTFLVNNKNISKESESLYRKIFEYIKYYDLLQSCIVEYNNQFDNRTLISLSAIEYKKILIKDIYYCGRCSKEVEKNDKTCNYCGARLY